MKQREPRHEVIVPARLRHGTGWTDATILNLSNRGLMFRSKQPLERGHCFELRRGGHVIIARVVWSDEERYGARAQGILPVADIVLDNPAESGPVVRRERRAEWRTPDVRAEASRQRGRAAEFGIIALALGFSSLLAADLAFGALSRPLKQVTAALDHP